MPGPLLVLGRPRLDENEAFSNLIEALRVAETSARQLAFMRNEKNWLKVQFGLESVREVATHLAQSRKRA